MYTPLQSGVNGVSSFFRGFGSIFSTKQSLLNKIENLEKENGQIKIENQALRENTDELLRLRNIVDFIDVNKLTYNLVTARVIARSPNNWYKTLTINKGAQQGIIKDMAVISPDGLVGRIESVNDNSAQVILITDREVAVGAILQRTRDTNGIVEGRDDSSLLVMRNIPYYSKIRKGDRVITSGLSEYYPKGILIGTVKQTKREPGGLLLSAEVAPGVEFDKLEEVLVVTGYHPPVNKDINSQEEQ
jgi:rod shape-determining protein MreC